MNVFALMDLANKYADTINAGREMAPELVEAYNEFQAFAARHDALIKKYLPEDLQLAYREGQAIVGKYGKLFTRVQANMPQMIRLVAEAQAIVKQA